MPLAVVEFEPTPNPNAVKVVLDGVVSRGTRSFPRPELGADIPIAAALFAIPGVTALMFCNDFVTISKATDADWGPIKAKAKKVLAAHDAPDEWIEEAAR